MITALPSWIIVSFLAISAAVTAGMALYTYRNRRYAGANWLTVTLLATTLWSGSYAAGLLTHNPEWRPFWEHFQWFGTAVLPVSFLLFTLEYTGYDRLISRQRLGALFVIPAVTILLVWTNESHNLMWEQNRVVVQDGLATMVATFGPWFWVALGYSYLLVLIGGVLLIRLLFISKYLYFEQSVLFSLGIVIPLLGNIVAVFVPTSPPGFDFTPYGFAIWGVTLFVIVYRGELFTLLPAARALGQNAALAQIDDGVLITDCEWEVIYVNRTVAELLDSQPAALVGQSLEDAFGEYSLSFDTPTAMAELEHRSRQYELRSSPITDRSNQQIGHTVTMYDVTARHRREQRLAAKQRELERIEELNAAIRGVNQVLVSSSNRAEITDATCETLYEHTRYESVCIADASTAIGTADNWTQRGKPLPTPTLPNLDPTAPSRQTSAVVASDEHTDDVSWVVAPVVYRNVLYGVICVGVTSEQLPARERAVLAELGELLGHAIEAVENRQLLWSDTVVEVTLENDSDAPLARVAATTGSVVELEGIVPKADGQHIAFLAVAEADTAAVAAALEEHVGNSERVREMTDDDLVAVTLDADSPMGLLATMSTNLTSAKTDGSTVIYELEAPSDQVVRRAVNSLQRSFPETTLVSKTRTTDPVDAVSDECTPAVGDLTTRQEEALEAAFRMGYFDWPREVTAEEVAESMDISAATLHGHLRKAERTVFDSLFDTETPPPKNAEAIIEEEAE